MKEETFRRFRLYLLNKMMIMLSVSFAIEDMLHKLLRDIFLTVEIWFIDQNHHRIWEKLKKKKKERNEKFLKEKKNERRWEKLEALLRKSSLMTKQR